MRGVILYNVLMNYTPLEPVYRRRAVRNKSSVAPVLLSVLAVTVISYIATSWTLRTLFPTNTRVAGATIMMYPTLPTSSDNLSRVVDKAMEGSKGTYGIIIKNLKTEEIYHKNEHTRFESASLYKLWIMGTVYSQFEDGTLKPDDPLTADVEKLNKQFDIATESAELTEGALQFTIASALRQMITISHNYAALALSQRVKLSNVRAFLSKYELEESFIGQPPKTSAYDIGIFLEKLYEGKIISPSASKEMLALLKDQELNNKLPAKLSENVVIAHKTGEIGTYTHDAGIVYTPKGDYLIVMLSNSDYPPGAEDRIATLSKAVYDYFNE